jgi:hypothetical protein
LTALTSGVLPAEQSERLITNRFVNVQGGRNNNIALDEYLEMLNRDSKVACSGHQTKESIIKHSQEYPILINFVKHYDVINRCRVRKGFHHLPSYLGDVKKVAKVLLEKDVLTQKTKRELKCKTLCHDRNPYENTVSGLATMIHRHRPSVPVRRLRNVHI